MLALLAASALALSAPAFALGDGQGNQGKGNANGHNKGHKGHDDGDDQGDDSHGGSHDGGHSGGGDKPWPPTPRPTRYLVGGATRSINPTGDMLADKGGFYLGGFGLGSGKAGGQVDLSQQDPTGAIESHQATGILNNGAPGYGVAVRAMAVGDGHHAIVLAQLDLQGYFSAYKQGPFGLIDIRRDAAQQIANEAHGRTDVPSAGAILVDSNHSHAGPDTTGVWGGVPTSYLRLVHDRAVAAIVDAWHGMRSSYLYYGTIGGGVEGETDRYPSPDPLLSNDFSDDPNNKVMDDQLRVLRAVDPATGTPTLTYLNFSAHPTVLGGGNRKVSADYTGPLSNMLASEGGMGFAQVATLGRTHTAGPRCQVSGLHGDDAGICAIDGYARRVMNRAQVAIANAKPVMGPAAVAMHSFLLTDAAENAPIVSLSYAGTLVGAPVYRSVNPPWLTGDVLGTPTFSGRIGNILINGGPGEMYPQILDTVKNSVGAQGNLSIGTAGDFLGYLIAPLEAYPEPVRHDILDGPPPPAVTTCFGVVPTPIGCPAPIDSDNHLFNPSFTLGERITCSLLRGAAIAFGQPEQTFWSTYQRCAAFADDLVKPADFDTTFPAQPDLSSVLTH